LQLATSVLRMTLAMSALACHRPLPFKGTRDFAIHLPAFFARRLDFLFYTRLVHFAGNPFSSFLALRLLYA
jgi:hypothetical protein